LKIQTHITRMDLLRMNILLIPKAKSTWITAGVVFCICFAITYSHVNDTYTFQYALKNSTIVSLIFTLVFSIITPLLNIFIYIITASENTGLGSCDYELTSKGLYSTNNTNEIFTKWFAFKKVWKFKSYIFLMRHWAHIDMFPRREFTSQEHFEEFHEYLVRHMKTT